MSFLTTTHTLTTRTPLAPSTSHAQALTLLHDITAFPALQPLVTQNTPLPPPSPPSLLAAATTATATAVAGATTPEYRAVTAAVPFGIFGTKDITTRSGYVKTEDGLVCVFEAPLGLHGVNRWRLVVEAGGLVLVEEAVLTGFVALMPFVVGTEGRSHAELGRRFARELERREGRGGGGGST